MKCKTPDQIYNLDSRQNENLSYQQWTTKDGRSIKVQINGVAQLAAESLCKAWTQYLSHCFYKDNQAEYFEDCRTNISDNQCVIQVDCLENYHTGYEDEVQSAHFTYRQVTLFTCWVWVKDSHLSYCLVSDYLQHDKYTVMHFYRQLLPM